MKSRIVLFALFNSIILLTIPSISSLELSLVDNLNQKNEIFKKDILELFGKLSKDPAPKWFTLLFIFIMFSLSIRIEILTPLALTPSGEYWGQYEVNSYFFFVILLTLVYRFAFWYNLFDKILEKNNWERP